MLFRKRNKHEYWGEATRPGHVSISDAKLRELRPDMYTVRGRWKRFVARLRRRKCAYSVMQHHLYRGDANPAMVVCVSPLLVAAYSIDLDCVAMLRFPDHFVQKYRLTTGSRLVSINTYFFAPVAKTDLMIGPNHTGQFTNLDPIIADFVSDDADRIEQLKKQLPAEEWNCVEALGPDYLAKKPGVYRDGRPMYASRPGPIADLSWYERH